MTATYFLGRAFGGEPKRLEYLGVELTGSIRAAKPDGGYMLWPPRCAYEYDAALEEQLMSACDEHDRSRVDAIWDACVPFCPPDEAQG